MNKMKSGRGKIVVKIVNEKLGLITPKDPQNVVFWKF